MSDRDVDHDNCPQCGEKAEVFVEGYCQDCTNNNYMELTEFSWARERWARMSQQERMQEIRWFMDGE